jgi:hypothetical protein
VRPAIVAIFVIGLAWVVVRNFGLAWVPVRNFTERVMRNTRSNSERQVPPVTSHPDNPAAQAEQPLIRQPRPSDYLPDWPEFNRLRSSGRGSPAPRQSPLSSTQSLIGERYPATRLRYLTPADVSGWSTAKLRFAINEMFARHGAVFEKQEVGTFYRRFSWYHPRPGIKFDTIEQEFNPIEKYNVKLLGATRDAKRQSR